jgi:hypothetical protein
MDDRKEKNIIKLKCMKKLKTINRLSILFLIECVLSLSVYAQDNTECIKILNPKYSIKNRWNIKASYSLYNTIHDIGSFHWEKSNTRLEANYGFNSCLEAGIYGGVQLFHGIKIVNEDIKLITGTASTFGVEINFHLLPLFVQNPDSPWELYLTAKYGGILFTYKGGNTTMIDGTPIYLPTKTKYEHEYSIGVGGGVYFWKIFGLYAEFSLGQFYSLPTYDDKVNIPCKLRGGFAFKF